jgi:hypothetical protein
MMIDFKLIVTLCIAVAVGSCIYGVTQAQEQGELERTYIRDRVRLHGTDADNYLYDACDRAFPSSDEDRAFLKCLEVLDVWDGDGS